MTIQSTPSGTAIPRTATAQRRLFLAIVEAPMHYQALSHVLGVIVATTAMSYAQLSDVAAASPNLDSTAQSSITGVVTDLAGKPLHDIRVEAHYLGTGEIVGIVVSGMNGSFSVRGIHAG